MKPNLFWERLILSKCSLLPVSTSTNIIKITSKCLLQWFWIKRVQIKFIIIRFLHTISHLNSFFSDFPDSRDTRMLLTFPFPVNVISPILAAAFDFDYEIKP